MIIISILALFNMKNGYLNYEEFIVDYKKQKIIIDKNKKNNIQLNCIQEENELICKNAVPQKEIIRKNYPPLNYEKGLSESMSDGYIEFKQVFNKTPNVYTQPIIDEEYLKNENALSVDVYNVSNKGFFYKKNIMESDEESGLTGLNPDDKNKFSWFAL